MGQALFYAMWMIIVWMLCHRANKWTLYIHTQYCLYVYNTDTP